VDGLTCTKVSQTFSQRATVHVGLRLGEHPAAATVTVRGAHRPERGPTARYRRGRL